ncbi:MAG: ATP-grasp domain-containing protein [Candidatus Komeilibacteria bacterium]|nr:ATP-grasp domain-containing protein [Candidatus Komeilibacteria bacterium]
MKQRRIAIFLNCLEPVFFSKTNQVSCFVLVEKNSVLHDFALKNLPASQIIPFDFTPKAKKKNLSYLQTLLEPDLLRQLKFNHITHFVIPHRLSQEMVLWSKKHGFKLVGMNLKQQRLENKLYFDNLLKKNNLASPKTLTLAGLEGKNRPKIWVAQAEESFGFFGTQFFKSGQAWQKFLKNKKPALRLLLREYLAGPSLGVSIFLDKRGNYFFSALRRQCFFYQDGLPKRFLGVQWLPKSFFSSKINRKIALILSELKNVLLKERFYGLANFDLLINHGQPLVLECNPRLSSATPQIFSIAQLTNFANPWQFYVSTFLSSSKAKIKANILPPSHFNGAIMDVDVAGLSRVKKVSPLGVYVWQKNKLVFISQQIKDYHNNSKALFLFHELRGRDLLKANQTLCTVFSQQPLFNIGSGTLNDRGLKIYRYLIKQFLGQQ